MKTKMTINGRDFEIIKARTEFSPTETFITLDDCYKSYSRTKEFIFDNWWKWFCELNGDVIFNGVLSYNCMMFTLGGYLHGVISEIGEIDIHLYITPAHNYAILNENDYNELKKACKGKDYTLIF